MAAPLIAIAERLLDDLRTMRFGAPVRHVYNPLEYAWSPHCEYLRRFGSGSHEILIAGMNAGYFGMAQTGVPFGDVVMVRDWLGIDGRVERPDDQHPRRPIDGFACRRREVSGQRLWGWARDAFGTPDRFFTRFFVANYCPLCFLSESGANLAIDKLPAGMRASLHTVCDRALHATARATNARYAIGVGQFAARRVEAVLGKDMACGAVLHPSPANPAAGPDWSREMDRALAAMGIDVRR